MSMSKTFKGKVKYIPRFTRTAPRVSYNLLNGIKPSDMHDEKTTTTFDKDPDGTLHSLGRQRVRAGFNPSGSSPVDDMKRRFAEIIDILEGHRIALSAGGPPDETDEAFRRRTGETQRTISIAQTEVENAAHWAIKAITH